jgi:hypothetical protein
MGEHRPRAHVTLTEVSRVSRVLRCSQKGRASAPGCPQTRRLTPCEGFPLCPIRPAHQRELLVPVVQSARNPAMDPARGESGSKLAQNAGTLRGLSGD